MAYLDAGDVAALCRRGRRITNGPLNATYEITVKGAQIFVRERLVYDDSYGQTFAGERHLPQTLLAQLHVPQLLQVVTEGGRERFALFSFVQGHEPDWCSPDILRALADMLAVVHEVVGPGLGNLGGTLTTVPARTYVQSLLSTELQRLPDVTAAAHILREWPSLIQALSCLDDEDVRLCHGDIHAGNLLTDCQGTLWTLDWEAARFRVAAADFNQLHVGWLTPEQQATVLNRYCDRTGRDQVVLDNQVRALRILWHVRTYNFYVGVLGSNHVTHSHQLHSARALMEQFR